MDFELLRPIGIICKFFTKIGDFFFLKRWWDKMSFSTNSSIVISNKV